MNIRLIQEQVFEITQEENISKSLEELACFFLVTLDYLRGGLTLEEYRTAFEGTCEILKKEKGSHRAAQALDSLLTAVFYYKLTVNGFCWQRSLRIYFNLSLADSYDLLIHLYEEETGEEIKEKPNNDKLFEELQLSGGLATFPKKEVWKETVRIFRKLKESGLLTLESHLGHALKQNKDELFLNRYPIVYLLGIFAGIVSIEMAIFILIFVARIAYDQLVEYPFARLMSLENAGKAYDHKMAEILTQSHSFIDNGIQVFGSRIIIFATAFLLFLLIVYIGGKIGERMYK